MGGVETVRVLPGQPAILVLYAKGVFSLRETKESVKYAAFLQEILLISREK